MFKLFKSIMFVMLPMFILVGITQSCTAQKKAIVTKTTALKWYDAGLGGDIKISPVHGDIQNGKHSTLVRFPAGTVTPTHTHSHDYYGVVISGNLRHPVENQPETDVSLPAGSHWFMPANVKHVTECEPGIECIVMLTQEKPFDFKPVAAAENHKH